MQRGGERRWGGLLGEEKCEVEDREWSVAVVAAAANANPQPAGSIVLDKMPGGRLMREYESIVIASASSSSGDDDDDGMLINNNFDGGNDFDGRGEVRTKESTDDDNDIDNDEDGESCNVNISNGVMSSLSRLNDELSLLMCLNDDELNDFEVDGILVKSITSILTVEDADKGGKDKKNDDGDDEADNNDEECSSRLTMVDGAKCNVRCVQSGSCRCRRCCCLLTDSVKNLFLVNSSLNMNMSQLSCGAVDNVDL